MALIKHKTISEALRYVATHPEWSGGTPIDSPVWEHVARALYGHATNPDTRIVGAMGRSTKATKIILDYSTGTRRAGTHPAQRSQVEVQFGDLTGGEIDE